MTLKITILGSSAMYATPEWACSGYLVESGGTTLWLEAGGGTWRNLQNHTDFTKVNGVMLTHRHPDHTIDVFQAFHARNYGCPEALPQIPLWAPQETIERLLGFAKELPESFDLRPISEDTSLEFAGHDFSFVRMAHPAETLGVRIEKEGAVLAFSSDTGPAADFERLAHDASLFLCEATFQDDHQWEGHLSAGQAGKIAAATRVKRLALTHLPAGRDLSVSLAQAQAAAPGLHIDIVQDGMSFEVGP